MHVEVDTGQAVHMKQRHYLFEKKESTNLVQKKLLGIGIFVSYKKGLLCHTNDIKHILLNRMLYRGWGGLTF